MSRMGRMTLSADVGTRRRFLMRCIVHWHATLTHVLMRRFWSWRARARDEARAGNIVTRRRRASVPSSRLVCVLEAAQGSKKCAYSRRSLACRRARKLIRAIIEHTRRRTSLLGISRMAGKGRVYVAIGPRI
jgi:hypothetical protein